MFKKTILSFGLAVQNIRTNLFHTFLSVLGIVIGVAALVAILSFIDGLEQFAKDEITKTTSLNTVIVHSAPYRTVGSVRVKKDSCAALDYSTYEQLVRGLPNVARMDLSTHLPAELQVGPGRTAVGAMVHAGTGTFGAPSKCLAGEMPGADDALQKRRVAVVNQDFAKQALGHEHYAALLNQTLRLGADSFRIKGVVQTGNKEPAPQAFLPVTALPAGVLAQYPPECYVEAQAVEYVTPLKAALSERLAHLFPGRKDDFEVFTNDYRVAQATQGFRLFRIIMGLVVGISILVGGIGVMNVLLIAVTERTTEIGIRKAVGASKSDVLRQFLAESVAVAAFGSLLGLLLGVAATLVIVPIVNAITGLPFQARYTWNTFFTISVVAVLVGIVFGTYPAVKAARLDPVEAIRRE